MDELIIKNKIYIIRNKQVLIDSDLALLYEINTKNLNKSVKRNIERFPDDFMFQLTDEEYNALRFQIGTSKQKGGRRYLPFVFTEQGIAMLSSVLNSQKAIKVNIQIMRAFISMRKFIYERNDILQKIIFLENNQKSLETKINLKFNKIFELLNQNPKPEKGIFFEGQLFDAHNFISNLIRSAKKEIILIDNYVDDNTLNYFTKKQKNIKTTIYTKTINVTLKKDIDKFNQQYGKIDVKKYKFSHDRFLIIDNRVYHIGASLKDIGKKWVGFSKMNGNYFKILNRLEYLK